MVDVKTCLDNAQEKMDMAIMYLEEALAHIRAGKASTRLLDGIRVDSYGSMVALSNVAALSTPDGRSITIKPWDKSMFRVIEKAIIDSDLGIMPENNGEIIRLGIPPLTEERRKQLAKQCKAEGETAKVSVRNARRDGIDALKKAVKDGLAEDGIRDGRVTGVQTCALPIYNGEIIRLGIPPLTEERRKQLAKQCKAEGDRKSVV